VCVPQTSQSTRTWLHRQLRSALYRFDCPTPLAIGEYELKVSPVAHQVQVAQHVLTCDDCTTELGLLRTYLAPVSALPEPKTMLEHLKRVVARLITPGPGLSLAGVRHTSGNQVQIVEAGDLLLTIGPGIQTTPGLASILGLFVDCPLVEGRVELIARNGARLETALDDLGGFEFSDLPEGSYDLQIELQDRLVVLDDFQVRAQ
jgi:hypothetical protein